MVHKRQRGAKGLTGDDRVTRSQRRYQNAQRAKRSQGKPRPGSDLARMENEDRLKAEGRERAALDAKMFETRRGRETLRAKYESVCPACWQVIEVGALCHVNVDGLIVHDRHEHVEPEVSICPHCHLTRPCDC